MSNPTIQNLFNQINSLLVRLTNSEAKIAAIEAVKHAAGIPETAKIFPPGIFTRLFPPQFKAGVVEHPFLLPFPYIEELEIDPKSDTGFGVAIEEGVGQANIDIDVPVYLERLTADLVKTDGIVSDGEAGFIPDPGIGYYIPLSAKKAGRFPTFLDGAGVSIPIQRYLKDFEWKLYFDKKQMNITADDWMSSALLDGDNEEGYRFDCEYPMKRGETLTVEARPLTAQIPETEDQWRLTFKAHMIKMLTDAEARAIAQAAADLL